jgi:hypothetical protein
VAPELPLLPGNVDKTPNLPNFLLTLCWSAKQRKNCWFGIQEQLVKDEARLRAVQNPDGTWGFDPGKLAEMERVGKPTASTILPNRAWAHCVAGFRVWKDDPAISRGVKALLSKQDPYGRWNKTAQTGFVTTAYALHALSRLYPETPEKPARSAFEAQPQESLRNKIARVRMLSHSASRLLPT